MRRDLLTPSVAGMSQGGAAQMNFNLATQQQKGILSMQVRQTLLAQQRNKQRQRLMHEQHAAQQQQQPAQQPPAPQQAFRQFSPQGNYARVGTPHSELYAGSNYYQSHVLVDTWMLTVKPV